MTRVRLALLGGALLAAAASLAYVRSTDSTTKACLYWGPRTVQYRINYGKTTDAVPAASPTCAQPDEASAVDTGFHQWTGSAQSCTDLNLVDDGVPGTSVIGFDRTSGATNENTVVFRSGWCSVVAPGCTDAAGTPLSQTCANRYGCFEDSAENGKDTLALTTTTYNQRTGEILDADMELNGWDGQAKGTIDPSLPVGGWYFTCRTPTSRCTTYGQPDCIWIDVQNTVTHEAGHFIGLAHPCGNSVSCAGVDSTTTMYPYSGPGDTAKRTLAGDDINGLCAIYPAGKATVTCVSPPKGGCASGEGAGISALLLAGAALLPRLRRRRA